MPRIAIMDIYEQERQCSQQQQEAAASQGQEQQLAARRCWKMQNTMWSREQQEPLWRHRASYS